MNPYANKVISFGQVLIDLTSDTVDAAHLLEGYTAHDKSGAVITGSFVPYGEYPKYRYYRLYITGFYRDSATDAKDFQNCPMFKVIGPGGVDLAQEYGVAFTASSTVSGGSPANAFDGDISTLWESDWKNVSSTEGWVAVELDEARTVIAFTVGSRLNQRDYPAVATIDASNDGTSWTTLISWDDSASSDARGTWQKGSTHSFFIEV